jgi:hypothetical protein
MDQPDTPKLLAEWQLAMRKRDQLRNVLDGLRNIQVDAPTFQHTTMKDVEEQLALANKEVERLQALVLRG